MLCLACVFALLFWVRVCVPTVLLLRRFADGVGVCVFVVLCGSILCQVVCPGALV